MYRELSRGAEEISVREETKGEREFPALDAAAWGAECCGERRDAAESRRRILDAARALFAERSVEPVSMHEVGRAAGVGQGTLYRRYEHKGALCGALLQESAVRFSEEVREWLEGDGGPALEKLVYFLEQLADFNEENAPLLGAIRDAAGGGRRHERYRNPFYRWLRETVKTLLELAVERREIPPLDTEYAADAILAPLNIDLYLFQRRELDMDRGRMTAAMRRLVLEGLKGSG